MAFSRQRIFFLLVILLNGCNALFAQQRNVLIILTDQQSADAMSFLLGNQYLRTPNMDRIAANGVVFTNAYSANPLCTPSRTAMITGRYPHETGIQDNTTARLDPKTFPTLGNLFTANGYETGYLGKWHLPFAQADKTGNGFQMIAHTKMGGSDSLLPEAAARFFNTPRQKPFLLVVSFNNPHNICEWARDEELPDGAVGDPPAISSLPQLLPNHAPTVNETDINRDMRMAIHANPKFPVGNFSEAKWREYRWVYYRLLEKADAYIGEVLNALESSGHAKNTLIVFTSDHGDMQGAHGWNQKTVLYEESVRVPFVITGPGVPVKKSTSLVNTGVDLIPTLCSYAGIKPLGQLSGNNVLEASKQAEYVVVSNRLSVGKNIFSGREKFEPEGRMLRSERYKYWIYDEGTQRESLFDITKDPGEMKDLARDPQYQKILEQHRRYLREWATRYHDQKAIQMLDYKGN